MSAAPKRPIGRPRKYHFTTQDLDTLTAKELSFKYGCHVNQARAAMRHHEAQKNPSTEWRSATQQIHVLQGKRYMSRLVPAHPLAYRDGRALEHMLVVYDIMGQAMLVHGSQIHHRNKDRLDNREENLIWFETAAGHTGLERWVNDGKNEVEFLATTEHKYVAFCPKLKKAIEAWTK